MQWSKVVTRRRFLERFKYAKIANNGSEQISWDNIKMHVWKHDDVYIISLDAKLEFRNKLVDTKPNANTSRSKRYDAPHAKNGNRQARPIAQVNVNYGHTSIGLAWRSVIQNLERKQTDGNHLTLTRHCARSPSRVASCRGCP